MQKPLQSLVWRNPYLGHPESVLLAMVARQNLEMCVLAVQVIQYPAIPAAAARPRKAWERTDEVLWHRLPGGPVHRMPRGGGHPAPRLAPVPDPHGAASRHYLPGPAKGGPRRRRGGPRAGRLRRVSGRRETTTTAADEVKLRSQWIWELLEHSSSPIIEPPLTTRTSANLG